MKLEVGNIIFVKPRNAVGRLISYFDNGTFSHCAICVDDDGKILQTDIFTNAVITPLNYAPQDIEIIDLKLTDEQKELVKKIAPKLVGIHYDYLLIAYYFVKKFIHLTKPWNSPRQMICSELVDYVLYYIGMIPEMEFLSGESPNELYANIISHFKL
jgi:hypothetical protein